MKIVLIGFNVQEDIFPLGLTYLKSYAQKYHPDVEFILKEFGFGNRFSVDTNANLEMQVLSYIMLQNPDTVCFSSYIWNNQLIKNISLTLRKINPKIKIVIGGVEADTNFATYSDYVITGEGEVKFVELINHLKDPKNNVFDNVEKYVKDMDDIPFPYKHHSGKKKYAVVRIETSRGCPYSCKYCYYAQKKFRNYSLDYVKENLSYLFDNYEFRNLTILDANINVNKNRMREILNYIGSFKRRIKVNFELKPELIDAEVISIIKDSKLRVNCELGLQSVDSEVLKECGRVYNIDKVKDGLGLLNSANILYKIDMMYGLPKDNFFKFLRTFNFIKKYSHQKRVPAHHFMVLNNTAFSSYERFIRDTSSMIVKTDTQNVLDFYKQKLFIDMVNSDRK